MKFLTETDLKNEGIDLSFLKVNDSLSPKFFDESNNLHPTIVNNLLRVVEKYLDFIDLKKINVKDIVMTGSLANYNYNDMSDVDIHILADLKKIDKNEDVIVNFFKAKKDLWAEKYDITIYGHPIELYVEDIDTAMKKDWVGMYSLITKSWVRKPEKDNKTIDYETIGRKSTEIGDAIDKIIIDQSERNIDDEEALKKIDNIKEKIKSLRDFGLNHEHSELSTENLIFKTLKNNGYLDKINGFKKNVYNHEFSINENTIKKILIIKESQFNTLKNSLVKYHNNKTI